MKTLIFATAALDFSFAAAATTDAGSRSACMTCQNGIRLNGIDDVRLQPVVSAVILPSGETVDLR